MSWTIGVPNPTDRQADTQFPIQTNFNLANSDFGVDHISFSGLTNQAPDNGSTHGYHYKMVMPDNSSASISIPASMAGVVLAEQTASNGQVYPFWRYLPPGETQLDYPMVPIKCFGSYRQSTNTLVSSFNCTASSPSTGTINVVFTNDLPFAAGTSEYAVLLTVLATGGPFYVQSSAQSATGFTIQVFNNLSNLSNSYSRVSFSILQL